MENCLTFRARYPAKTRDSTAPMGTKIIKFIYNIPFN